MNPRTWIILAGLLGASGVGLGAYHAHGLEGALKSRTDVQREIDDHMRNCGTAVRYHMYHALALLGVGLLGLHRRSRVLDVAAITLVAGMIGFSGGLYVHVFTGRALPWFVVPLGGLLLIAGWVALAFEGTNPCREPIDDTTSAE